MSTSSSPLVCVGEHIQVSDWPSEDGETMELRAKITAVTQKRKRSDGDRASVSNRADCQWRYELLCEDGLTLTTRLSHLRWKKLPLPCASLMTVNASTPLDCRFILAPMVGASELPFRLLCRRYGATIAYTPMMSSELFASDASYRARELEQTHLDRPLVAHFSANNPQTLLAAALIAQDTCDAIDINLGCPQRVAFSGHFGSFLLGKEDRDLVLDMVRTVSRNIRIPLFVKIRLLDTIEETIQLVRQLSEAGASMVAIHARFRVNLAGRSGPGARDGSALLDHVAAVKRALPHVKLITNGNVRDYADATGSVELTGADGVMSAEGLLDNPMLFSGATDPPSDSRRLQLALEYLELAATHRTSIKSVVFHIRRMCVSCLTRYQLLLDVVISTSIDQVKELVLRAVKYEKDGGFEEDANKAALVREAAARRKREEGRRKEYEARMIRKAKREGLSEDFYLREGADPPSVEEVQVLRSMAEGDAFQMWRKRFPQHCFALHVKAEGCPRESRCAFLHADVSGAADMQAFG